MPHRFCSRAAWSIIFARRPARRERCRGWRRWRAASAMEANDDPPNGLQTDVGERGALLASASWWRWRGCVSEPVDRAVDLGQPPASTRSPRRRFRRADGATRPHQCDHRPPAFHGHCRSDHAARARSSSRHPRSSLAQGDTMPIYTRPTFAIRSRITSRGGQVRATRFSAQLWRISSNRRPAGQAPIPRRSPVYPRPAVLRSARCKEDICMPRRYAVGLGAAYPLGQIIQIPPCQLNICSK